jgi:Tol biopolymer transport system component
MTPERWEKVNELFHSALGRAPNLRAAFLNQACGDDVELLKEVESLIRSHEQSTTFIDSPAFEIARDLSEEDQPQLIAGTSAGHYKIVSLLGRGGMGEVYLARDSRLGRQVALKLLPRNLTKDEDRVRRFAQEARAASALNHPNILTIHEIAEVDGLAFIATEYIEGVTLRQRLAGGRLQVSEALDLAVQVASALSAAHQIGIVHRDIKPENIMLRPDGYVKVLDFGLAKLTEQKPVNSEAQPQAFTAVKTNTGVVIGTASYMSPEQAKGQPVDQRSDVFSFGVVFYEMLTGEQAFRRDSDVDTLHAIIHDEPAGLSVLRAKLPSAVELVLRRCLEKEAERRYENGAELVAALKQASSAPISGSIWAAWPRWRRRWWVALIGVALIVLGTLAVAFLKRAMEASSKPASGTPLAPMRTVPFTNLPNAGAWDPSFSPDGSYVAFVSTGEDDNADIYVKLVDGGIPTRLTSNPALDISPVWSPDGRYIVFKRVSGTEGTILEIPVIGGSERKLFSTNEAKFVRVSGRIDWSADGKYIAYTDREAPGIFLWTFETQESRQLTFGPEHSGGADIQPRFSPDSQKVAFVRWFTQDVGDIYVVATAGAEPIRLTSDKQSIAGMSWTPDGREIVFSSDRGDTRKLLRILATGGEPQPVGVGSDGAFSPAVSRQGNRLVYSMGSFAMSTWRVDLAVSSGKAASKIKVLSSRRPDLFPQISPDGMQIAFGSSRSGPDEIWRCDSDGSNLIKLTNLGSVVAGSPRWSPDGHWIAFDARTAEQSAIYVIGANGGQPRRMTERLEDDSLPSWSADWHWIYFSSNRNGNQQVWKMPADGGDAVQVTRHGGTVSFESSDGEYVYYQRPGAVKGLSLDESPGLWRMRVDGAEEELVLDRGISSGLWALVDRGIYFVETTGKSGLGLIEFYDFRARQVKRVAAMEKPPCAGFAVSPDGGWLLYAQIDVSNSDIMLVENFR